MLWLPVTVLAALATLVSADVEFTSPKGGATLKGGEAVVVEWKDSGDTPALTDLTTYNLFLCAGGSEEGTYVDLLQITSAGTAFATTGNKATGTIGNGLGASTPKNAYFFRIESIAAKGGFVVNFSKRFSMSGMQGSFEGQKPEVREALKNINGEDGPAKVDKTAANAPANPADGDFGIAYTMQTGAMRYAPMQPIPKTKITKKDHVPAFPTSSVKIATTFLPIPKQQTTVTKSQTFSVSSRENPASPAPMPQDDMAKFLARWKD